MDDLKDRGNVIELPVEEDSASNINELKEVFKIFRLRQLSKMKNPVTAYSLFLDDIEGLLPITIDRVQWNICPRSEWKRGLWDHEPDLLVFRYRGRKIAIRRGGGGCWCGYVTVGPKHKDHGAHYGGLYMAIDVHGGLTFAGKPHFTMLEHLDSKMTPRKRKKRIRKKIEKRYGFRKIRSLAVEEKGLWWFGFDCGHSCDLSPDQRYSYGDGIYRDVEYALKEAMHLADQFEERGRS